MKTIDYDPDKIKFLPNLPRNEPFVMDSTAMKLLMECRRKYFYRIVLGRVSKFEKFPVILAFGSAYHKFREILELQGYGEAMRFILSVNLPTVEPTSKFAFYNNLRLTKTCQVAYEHWQKEKKDNKIEVVAVEQPFNVRLFDGSFTGGRADQVIKWNGRLWGRDFKSTTKDKATFTKQLEPNDQAIRYIVGESELHGQEIQGIVFEAVYNAKTVGPTIYSVNSTRNIYQKEQWLAEQALNNRLLKIYREEDMWPMDTGKCDWCEYHKVCNMKSMGSMESIIRSDFKHQPWDHTKVDQGTE